MAALINKCASPQLDSNRSSNEVCKSTTKEVDHVLIVGAGLCGLATAIGLRKAGIQVTILERSPELREIGAGIQIPPNAARVLAHLGVLSKTLTQSVRPQAIVLHSYSDGSPLHTLNIEPHAQNTYGFPLLVTHRANLCNILYQEALIQGVTVRFDCAVQQIDFSKAAVQVASGEIIDADVILATDGAHSVCREALLGHPHPPKPSGKLIYRVCIPSDTVRGYAELIDLIELPRIHIWLGPDVHVVCYGLEGLLNIVISQQEDGKSINFNPSKGNLDLLRQNFQGWDPRLQKLLELSEMTLRWSLPDSMQFKEWVHDIGRFALVGDAAHSTFPLIAQGAAMAFESAHVIASLLCGAKSTANVPALLRRYNSVRYLRTSKVDDLSRKSLDYLEMGDGMEQEERDRRLRDYGGEKKGEVFALVDEEVQRWLWGYDAEL